ncbi:hypothetical protein [Streptomyces sp. A012304]|uniref:hypothetical protein n=1 Tax=Streptomyces sp. A012304 TaxID=375446 RepID=UPI002231311F|nr:hypothetical protein [Streptomyces sp. A012304]GKQ36598.1 hypothetical protein ALMP_31380 [Streptomyces sp. A012304]
MTQSGQGEEPSARPAREGIVLPSDGGEPLLPGMTGDRTGPSGPRPRPYGGPQPYDRQDPSASAPPAGQTWGRPWGPEQQQPEQGRPLPGEQQWDTPQPTGPDAWHGQTGPAASQPGAGPLPPEGAPAPSYGQDASAVQPSPYGHGAPTGQPQPYGQDLPTAQPPSYGQDLPTAQPPSSYGQDSRAAQSASYGQGVAGAPLPPVDEGATQYIPPVSAGAGPMPASDEGATQYLPPVAAAPVDEGATQYIPPVAPGALPPESPSESTHFLGRAQKPQPQPGSAPMPGAGHPDAEATQYIPPVTGQASDRQPPAEFDNLFRGGAGGEAPAGATQQIPRFSEPEGYAPQPAYSAQPPGDPAGGRRGRRGDDDNGGGRGGRTGSRVPLLAAVGVAIAVVGLGAGALMAGGGGGDQGDDNKTVAASAPAGEGSASASADPTEQQAIALDKLLADSGSSRASVISAVADVKACTDLAQAATDLREAAKQRTELVTKLSALTVDRLPNHTALTTALTKAWQASASADDHYAAWADQTAADKKSCKKGQARTTAQTQAGNRESGTASTQKARAAKLWNEIAKKYGLTQRQPTQL